MFYKALIICSLFLTASGNSYSQFNLLNKNNGLYKLRIYLGDDTTSKFSSDNVNVSASENYLSISFLGYQTYHAEYLNTVSRNEVKSEGVILPAFSTNRTVFAGLACFGKLNDTCTINFKEKLIKNREGRSATISVLNTVLLFTDPGGGNYTQPDPYTYTKDLRKNGSLVTGTDSSDFSFTYNRVSAGKSTSSGSLVLNGQRLYVKIPPFQSTRRGKIMSIKHLKYDPGILIVKGDTIYAALDYGTMPVKVYMLNSLSTEEKLKIASYLFTIISEL